MSKRVYGITEIVGTSQNGIDDAIRHGIATAATTLRHLEWFEVGQIKGQIVDGAVAHFQVGMKLGFRYDPK